MSTSHHPQDEQSPAPTAGLESAARRRALLKGLGKGAALAGSAVPLSSLATGGQRPGMRLKKTDGNYYYCSVSGNGSIMLSAGTSTPPTCVGKACSYYKKDWYGKFSTWPKNVSGQYVCIVGSNGYPPTTRFCDIFIGGTTKTIGDCVNTASPDDNSHWVTAMLNATVCASTFPYTTTEVLALYNDSTQRTAAITFFKNYMATA